MHCGFDIFIKFKCGESEINVTRSNQTKKVFYTIMRRKILNDWISAKTFHFLFSFDKLVHLLNTYIALEPVEKGEGVGM